MSKILGYDCDHNEISEYRILRSTFSEFIEDWDNEPNIDPRLYCAIESSNKEYWAISVYDNNNDKHIRRFEQISDINKVPTIVKPLSEMEGYEVAFSGITEDEWHYEGDKKDLKKKIRYNIEK